MKKSNTQIKKALTVFRPQDYVRQGITIEEIQQVKDAFDLFDPDRTGIISPKDLKTALASFGYDKKSQTFFQTISDREESNLGGYDFTCFLHMLTAQLTEKQSRASVHKLFNIFDDDKAGFISIKNLRRVVKDLAQNIDDHDLQQMIDKADLDRDGLVSQEEFYQIFAKKL